MSDEPAIPAATLVVMRDAAVRTGKPEILVVERAATMAFAAGALVFPGGRIDDSDRAFAESLGRGPDAARVTAIRETIEESAVPAGIFHLGGGALDPESGRSLQEMLLGGMALDEALVAHDLALDLDLLVPFARWMPAFKQPRRFDTIFFIAPAPPGEWRPVPQPGECEAARWAPASALLEQIGRGEASAIFPTKRNLERIALHSSFEEAAGDARRHSLETIIPWIERRNGGDFVRIPEGRGYPVTSEPVSSALRA